MWALWFSRNKLILFVDTSKTMVRWPPPPPSWVKMNHQVSLFIIQDKMGQIMGSCFRIHNLFSSVFMV
ncbi:hypothetical protein ES288_D05G319600v1 [Gossypium darwinii]|uniref:Uncharacterized protein n=1 Tax=Gossypium darwinii TaxID=34276 RepID=A0A5D2CPJ1_GOSDA|nr:hypothetical protein ES288_D05G319600v1 [Gossypium darwinii]